MYNICALAGRQVWLSLHLQCDNSTTWVGYTMESAMRDLLDTHCEETLKNFTIDIHARAKMNILLSGSVSLHCVTLSCNRLFHLTPDRI